MTLSFFISLTIALIAAFVAYQSQEEIVATFSSIIALIGLLIGLVLAPWMAQILILVAALGGMRWFCHRHSCQDSTHRLQKR